MNKYKSHLLILCEDNINKEIVQGFVEHLEPDSQNRIKILDLARGWRKCLYKLEYEHIEDLCKNGCKYLLIVMDFDECFDERYEEFQRIIDDYEEEVKDRVFLIGSKNTPEELKSLLNLSGHNDDVGRELYDDCCKTNKLLWNSEHLSHNHEQILKLKQVTSFINWGFK